MNLWSIPKLGCCMSPSRLIVILSTRNDCITLWAHSKPPKHILHGAKGVAGPALVVLMIAECISAKNIRELLGTRFITHRSWRVEACLRAAH